MQPENFRHLLNRAFFVPLIVMGLLAGILLWETASLISVINWVDHTDRVISEGRRLLRLILDMETGTRGFLLAGDQQFLQPYQNAEPRVEESFNQLQQMVSHDSEQTRQLALVRQEYDTWHDSARQLIAARSGRTGYQSFEANLVGKQLMDTIRQHHGVFMETEQGLRDMRVRKARQDTRLLFITGILLAISLGLLLAIYTRRQLLRLSQTYSKWVNLAERRAQDLQDSHEWLDTTLHSIGDAVIATDVKGMLQFMNPIAEKVTGWTREEAQGRPLREVFNISNEQTHEPVESPVQKVMRLGTVVGLGNHTMLRRKDGSEVPIDDSGAPIRHRNGEIFGVVLVFRDVSGRRRAEQAMRSSEKLAVVGRLAASIAHEIHNPLDSVYNLLYLLERNPGLPAEARDMTQIAMDELARVTQITRQMLTYTRETQMPVEVKPSDLLDSVLTLYSGRINSGQIHLHREYDFAGSIRTYPGEMRQVFSNLLLNAFDAVGQGGTVKLRLAQSRDWGHEERAGVRVTISDNGTGIRPEHRARVLEPFFTTKGEKGTGLGLWVTAGILNKYGGSMRFRTSQQPRYRGTVFSVFIPDAALEVQPSAMDARAS